MVNCQFPLLLRIQFCRQSEAIWLFLADFFCNVSTIQEILFLNQHCFPLLHSFYIPVYLSQRTPSEHREVVQLKKTTTTKLFGLISAHFLALQIYECRSCGMNSDFFSTVSKNIQLEREVRTYFFLL